MHVITDKTAAALREKYIQTFINCTLPYYTERVLQLKKYSDGECYTGYLWDCLKNASTITETQAFEKMHASTEPFLSCGIYIPARIYSFQITGNTRNLL